LPLQVCFCGTKGAIDEYRFTCVVFVRRHIDKDLYRLN